MLRIYIIGLAILLIAISFAALIPPIPIILFINNLLPDTGTWNLFYATIPFVYVANNIVFMHFLAVRVLCA